MDFFRRPASRHIIAAALFRDLNVRLLKLNTSLTTLVQHLVGCMHVFYCNKRLRQRQPETDRERESACA